MASAEFLAGMAFNSASLGYVHAMAHQLGGFYNAAHGVCNAVLLPVVQKYNAKHLWRESEKNINNTGSQEKTVKSVKDFKKNFPLSRYLERKFLSLDVLSMYFQGSYGFCCHRVMMIEVY